MNGEDVCPIRTHLPTEPLRGMHATKASANSAPATRYFRRWSIYIGGENLTNFKQKNPIIDAADPWGDRFDSTMIWGPVHGAKGYIGVRFNLARD